MAVTHPLFEKHRAVLEAAVNAIQTRGYWSAYPEAPSGKIYGETAKDDGLAKFQSRLNHSFTFDQPGTIGQLGEEISPYGMKLGITYPKANLNTLLDSSHQSMKQWSRAALEARIGIALEILHRLNQRSFEIAFAVMHTTGQGFMMAFQAGGPHAQDRGLEAVAYAYEQMRKVPQHVTWQKQVSKTDVVRLEKTYRIVPRGIAAVIGCSTFPTWNSYPGLFASLVTGNTVVVKPHPGAVLPLAITVEIAREVLKEEDFDPNVIALAADSVADPIAKQLVTHPDVKIIDYTGSTAFGQWIEENASQAAGAIFTEKAGVNSVIIDSVEDLKAVTGNLAFTLSLYSGQMCTTSQNIFVPRDGIRLGSPALRAGSAQTSRSENRATFDEIAKAIVGAVNWFLSEPKRANEVLGAIQNPATVARIDEAQREAEKIPGAQVLRASEPIAHEQFPQARTRSPLIIKCDAKDEKLYMREMFGPIAYIIAADSTQHSIALAKRAAIEHGAITWAAYSTDASAGGVLEQVEEAAAGWGPGGWGGGVALSCNLTGQIWVNHSAAFSDYHVSGCNPSGNATLTDAAFVAPRFRIVQTRVPAPLSSAAPADVETKPASVPARTR